MNDSDAMSLIRKTLEKVTMTEPPAEFGRETDLIESGMLDSLDSMVFALELELASGKSFPDDVNLVSEGYYTIPKLLSFLTTD